MQMNGIKVFTPRAKIWNFPNVASENGHDHDGIILKCEWRKELSSN